MKKILYIILIATLFGSCKTKKKTQETTLQETIYQTTNLVASFEKNPCFGVCPVFTLEIYGDGKVVYIGTQNVENIGKHIGKVNQSTIKELIDKAKEINFEKLENKYDGPVSDLPATYTGILLNGNFKKIMARYDVPEQLIEFNKYFDQLIKDIPLEKVQD